MQGATYKEVKKEKLSLRQRQLQIAACNDKRFNLDKAIEEFSELILALIQKRTKAHTSKPVKNQEIIDEIGDAKRYLWVLEQIYGKEAVKERIEYKINQQEKKLK